MSNGLIFYDLKFVKYNLALDPLVIIASFFRFFAEKYFSADVTQTVDMITRPIMIIGLVAFAIFFALSGETSKKMRLYSIVHPNKRLIRLTHLANVITFSAMCFFMYVFGEQGV